MLIDRHMPTWDERRVRSVRVEAHVEEAYDALGAARVEDPILRWAFIVSRLPERLKAHAQGRRPLDLPDPPTLKAVAWREDLIVLDERPPEQAVSGLVVALRPWRPPRVRRLASTDFAAFAEPRHVKVATALSLQPVNDQRTIVRMEARATATDPTTRELLAIGWLLASPGAIYAMDATLDAIRRTAERVPPPPPPAREPAEREARDRPMKSRTETQRSWTQK